MPREHRALIERSAVVVAGIVILAAAVWFRVLHLFTTPFWVDEAYSSYNAGRGFSFIWNVVPLYDSHPPLYYTLLRLWSTPFGDSLVSYRIIGIVCGLLTVIVTALAASEIARMAGRRALGPVLAAAALSACAPLLIEESREVRPYPLMILAYAFALLAIMRVARESASGLSLSTRSFTLFLIFLEAMLWLHNLGPVFAAALTIAFLIVAWPAIESVEARKRVIVGFAVAVIAYLPCLVVLLGQARMWSQTTAIRFRWSGLQWKLSYIFGAVSVTAIIAAVILATAGVAALSRREHSRVAIALLVAALFPATVSIVVSVFVSPVFLVRTLTPLGVPVVLLLAGGLIVSGRERWMAVIALAVLLVQNLAFDAATLRRPPKEDWYSAVRWLSVRFAPGDAVYAYPNEGALPFDRAVGDLKLSIPSTPVPTAVPSPAIEGAVPRGNRGVLTLPRPLLRLIATSPRTRSVRTVWLLRLGPESHDFDDAFLHELSAERVEVGRWRRGAIDIIGLRRR